MKQRALILLAILLLLSACASDSSSAGASKASNPALCPGSIAPLTACPAVITYGPAFESARAQTGEAMTLTASYCGIAATGYELGSPVMPDAGGFHTWQWRAPSNVTRKCTTATLSLTYANRSGVNTATYTILPYN